MKYTETQLSIIITFYSTLTEDCFMKFERFLVTVSVITNWILPQLHFRMYFNHITIFTVIALARLFTSSIRVLRGVSKALLPSSRKDGVLFSHLLGSGIAPRRKVGRKYVLGGATMSSVSLLELPESVLLRVFWYLCPADLYNLSRWGNTAAFRISVTAHSVVQSFSA